MILHPANPNTGRTARPARTDESLVGVPRSVLDDLISIAGQAHAERTAGRPNVRCRACRIIGDLPNHVLNRLTPTVRHAHGIPALLLGCACVDPACPMKERDR